MGIRQEGADELELRLHGQHVAGAGHVVVALAFVIGQHGGHGVAHGGVDHGLAAVHAGVEGRLRHGRGDGAYQVALLRHLLGDLLAQAHIRLRVLHDEGHIFTFHIAHLGQALNEALAAVVQAGVLGKLRDADGVGLVGLGCGQRGGQAQGQSQYDRSQLLHHDSSILS